MYDDGFQYSAPGALNWKFAGGPKAEYDTAKASKKEAGPVEVLTQHKHHHKLVVVLTLQVVVQTSRYLKELHNKLVLHLVIHQLVSS